jgi:ribonuclease P protein component
VVREGKRIRTEHLEFRAAVSPLAHPRIGFIVPKHKQTGVARNRLKRWLREITRLRILRALPAVDLVVRARPEAYAASMGALSSDMCRAVDRIGALFQRP